MMMTRSVSLAIFIKELSLETDVDDASLISIDNKGANVRLHQGAQVTSKNNLHKTCFVAGVN